jgi:hypothetical protein
MRYLDYTTGEVIEVPAGFVSDGASIPRFAWTLIGHPLHRRVRRSGVLHDFECRYQLPWSSTTAHRRFGRALRVDGLGSTRAWIMERSVRGFGPRWQRREGTTSGYYTDATPAAA